MYVMLKQNWPSVFRRCVRDDKDQIIETLEFTPGEVREFDDDGPEAAAIARDIANDEGNDAGKAILRLMPDDRRILRSGLIAVPAPADAAALTPGGPPSTPTTIVDALNKPLSKAEKKAIRKQAVAAATAVKPPAAAAPQQPAFDPTALPPIDEPTAPESDE